MVKCGNCDKECKHYQSISDGKTTKRYYRCPSCHTIMIQTLRPSTKYAHLWEIIQTTTHTPIIKRPQSTLDNYF